MPQYRAGLPSPWRIQIRDENGVRRNLSFSTKADALEAEHYYRRQRQRIQAGLDIPWNPIYFEVFAKDWLASRKKSKAKNKSTWAGEEARLNAVWLPLFHGRYLHTITKQEIARKLEVLMLVDKLSPATRNRHRAMLHTIFQSAVKAEPPVLAKNPVSGIPALSEKKKTRETGGWKNSEDTETYLQASYAIAPVWGTLFTFLAWSGARVGEALALRWSDIVYSKSKINISRLLDSTTGKIYERTKGQREGGKYELLLLPRVAEALQKWRAISPKPAQDDLVFVDAGGRVLNYWKAHGAHVKAISAAKVPSISLHGLRHVFASNSRKAGMSREDIREVLGHEDARTTDIYIDDDIESLVEKARRLRFGEIPVTAVSHESFAQESKSS